MRNLPLPPLLLLLLAASLCAVPSQRDVLVKSKLAAQNAYTDAARKKDPKLFLEAAAKIEAVGAQVVAANRAVISAIRPSPPPDVKTANARKIWQNSMDNYRSSLEAANQEISSFRAPTEMAPETIRSVDRLIRAIDKGIEVHHSAAPNIR